MLGGRLFSAIYCIINITYEHVSSILRSCRWILDVAVRERDRDAERTPRRQTEDAAPRPSPPAAHIATARVTTRRAAVSSPGIAARTASSAPIEQHRGGVHQGDAAHCRSPARAGHGCAMDDATPCAMADVVARRHSLGAGAWLLCVVPVHHWVGASREWYMAQPDGEARQTRACPGNDRHRCGAVHASGRLQSGNAPCGLPGAAYDASVRVSSRAVEQYVARCIPRHKAEARRTSWPSAELKRLIQTTLARLHTHEEVLGNGLQDTGISGAY